jgi:hypothetical protein
MARMKRGAKTLAIREYVAANPDQGPKAIVAGLKVQGMTVKPGLVSAVKYGKKDRKRSARRPSVRAAARHTSNGVVTVEQLIEVKKLADSLGGAHQVRSALDALDMLR